MRWKMVINLLILCPVEILRFRQFLPFLCLLLFYHFLTKIAVPMIISVLLKAMPERNYFSTEFRAYWSKQKHRLPFRLATLVRIEDEQLNSVLLRLRIKRAKLSSFVAVLARLNSLRKI